MFVFSSIHFQCLYRPDAQCSCFLPFIFNAYTDQTLNLPTLNLPTRRSIYISIYLSTLNLSIYLSRIFFSFSHTPITPPCRSARTIASAASARTVQLVSRKAHLSVQALFVTDIFFIFAHVSVFFRSFSMLIPTRRSIYQSIYVPTFVFSSIHFQCLYRPDAQSMHPFIYLSIYLV